MSAHRSPGRFRRVLYAAICDAFGACRERGLVHLRRADADRVLDHIVAAIALDARLEPDEDGREPRVNYTAAVASALDAARPDGEVARERAERRRSVDRVTKQRRRRRESALPPNTVCSVCGRGVWRRARELRGGARIACSRRCKGLMLSRALAERRASDVVASSDEGAQVRVARA